jgi:hypothetical protein
MRILIIEDSPLIRRMYGLAFSRQEGRSDRRPYSSPRGEGPLVAYPCCPGARVSPRNDDGEDAANPNVTLPHMRESIPDLNRH